METLVNLLSAALAEVWLSVQHNWPYLAVSVIIAALLKLYVSSDKVSAFLNRNRGASVVTATAVAVATPLCSCGTTAVILGMMASHTSWAPVVAFMVASPLTSPEGLVYSAGLFGWPFALAFYVSSIVLGLAGGWLAAVFEARGWLANQTRFVEPAPAACACSGGDNVAVIPTHAFALEAPGVGLGGLSAAACCAGAAVALPVAACGCGQGATSAVVPAPARSESRVAAQAPKVTLPMALAELYKSGKMLVVMFLGFSFVGNLLNSLIPAGWVAAVFGSGSLYNVPLAATLGLPFYINSEASLPLVRGLLNAGMSQGAALAFLIAGAGTSLGALAGALTIARWRVVGLVVGTLWVGAMLCGFALDAALKLGLF